MKSAESTPKLIKYECELFEIGYGVNCPDIWSGLKLAQSLNIWTILYCDLLSQIVKFVVKFVESCTHVKV